jgi:hypothetical protein
VLEMAPHVIRRASPPTAQAMQDVLAGRFPRV